MDDIESFSSDEEGTKAKGQNVEQPKDKPSASTVDPSAPLISQKRTHESSSSDSDKETPSSVQNSLQLVPAHPSHNGWVQVSKKKGRKCHLEVSTHSG